MSPLMATKMSFVCDCCFRETDNNLGWAHVKINGASDGKQPMPNDERAFVRFAGVLSRHY
jgi:hypothetical protein